MPEQVAPWCAAAMLLVGVIGGFIARGIEVRECKREVEYWRELAQRPSMTTDTRSATEQLRKLATAKLCAIELMIPGQRVASEQQALEEYAGLLRGLLDLCKRADEAAAVCFAPAETDGPADWLVHMARQVRRPASRMCALAGTAMRCGMNELRALAELAEVRNNALAAADAAKEKTDV